MKVLKYNYEFKPIEKAEINHQKTETIPLECINLFVGKNASGKSTLVHLLAAIADSIKGQFLRLGNHEITLQSKSNKIYTYKFNVDLVKNVVHVSETLFEDEKVMIERTNTSAKMYSESSKSYIEVNPPLTRLVIQVRRDEREFPYLEEIIKWAEGVHSFRFGHIHSTSSLAAAVSKSEVFTSAESLTSIAQSEFNKILGELTPKSRLVIMDEMNSLGYNIESISVREVGKVNTVYIKEKNLNWEIHQRDLSQGMYRALFLLIFIHYILGQNGTKMVTIDDLCEGLDYERATKLGKLLFKKMKEMDVQFIATSNDYFLINVTDVKYWNIVFREKSIIRTYNHTNSKAKFEEFIISGLNNFDLLSSNFLK